MFSIGLHCRLIGRPGKIAGLMRFLDYAQSQARRLVPPPHRHRPPLGRDPSPHPPRTPQPDGPRHASSPAIGGIFEHSPWIAERAFALELGPAHDSATGLHNALARMFRSASDDERLGVLRAHPDLAGKLAAGETPDARIAPPNRPPPGSTP